MPGGSNVNPNLAVVPDAPHTSTLAALGEAGVYPTRTQQSEHDAHRLTTSAPIRIVITF